MGVVASVSFENSGEYLNFHLAHVCDLNTQKMIIHVAWIAIKATSTRFDMSVPYSHMADVMHALMI
jgi:hypothetical protein